MAEDIVGLDPAARAARQERLGAYFDGWVATRLSGLRSSTTTGWGKWTNTKKVDIVQDAIAFEDHGNNPYNSWLNPQGQPSFNVYPKTLGFYMGEGFASKDPADNQDVKRILLEHATLTLRTQSGTIYAVQPLITLSPGLGIMTFSTDAFVYSEQFGPLAPMGMFKLPEVTAFSSKDTPQMIIQIDSDAQAELVSQAGSFPDPGVILGVRLIGLATYTRNAGRG